MTCLRPWKKKTESGIVEIPCGHCVNCTIKKIQYNKYLATKELEWCVTHNLSSSFVRLSYNDMSLPVIYNGELKRLGQLVKNDSVPTNYKSTLLKSDFIKFIKRFRDHVNRKFNTKFKIAYCGEYGDDSNYTMRPHFHLVVFGLDPIITDEICKKLWNFGFIKTLPVKAGAIGYMCKYMFHDVYGDLRRKKYTDFGIEPPFYHHSCNMGDDIIMQDIENDPELSYVNGKKIPYPKYIREKYGASINLSKTYKNRNEQISENVKKAENYSIQLRQKGIPLDSTSLYENESIVDTLKINNLTSEALK